MLSSSHLSRDDAADGSRKSRMAAIEELRSRRLALERAHGIISSSSRKHTSAQIDNIQKDVKTSRYRIEDLRSSIKHCEQQWHRENVNITTTATQLEAARARFEASAQRTAVRSQATARDRSSLRTTTLPSALSALRTARGHAALAEISDNGQQRQGHSTPMLASGFQVNPAALHAHLRATLNAADPNSPKLPAVSSAASSLWYTPVQPAHCSTPPAASGASGVYLMVDAVTGQPIVPGMLSSGPFNTTGFQQSTAHSQRKRDQRGARDPSAHRQKENDRDASTSPLEAARLSQVTSTSQRDTEPSLIMHGGRKAMGRWSANTAEFRGSSDDAALPDVDASELTSQPLDRTAHEVAWSSSEGRRESRCDEACHVSEQESDDEARYYDPDFVNSRGKHAGDQSAVRGSAHEGVSAAAPSLIKPDGSTEPRSAQSSCKGDARRQFGDSRSEQSASKVDMALPGAAIDSHGQQGAEQRKNLNGSLSRPSQESDLSRPDDSNLTSMDIEEKRLQYAMDEDRKAKAVQRELEEAEEQHKRLLEQAHAIAEASKGKASEGPAPAQQLDLRTTNEQRAPLPSGAESYEPPNADKEPALNPFDILQEESDVFEVEGGEVAPPTGGSPDAASQSRLSRVSEEPKRKDGLQMTSTPSVSRPSQYAMSMLAGGFATWTDDFDQPESSRLHVSRSQKPAPSRKEAVVDDEFAF